MTEGDSVDSMTCLKPGDSLFLVKVLSAVETKQVSVPADWVYVCDLAVIADSIPVALAKAEQTFPRPEGMTPDEDVPGNYTFGTPLRVQLIKSLKDEQIPGVFTLGPIRPYK